MEPIDDDGTLEGSEDDDEDNHELSQQGQSQQVACYHIIRIVLLDDTNTFFGMMCVWFNLVKNSVVNFSDIEEDTKNFPGDHKHVKNE